ncbi:AAA family ATPase [Methylocapsa polymorpha]|uniref:AAA family ATPase n=1 Tax=Methylocapsa polymorpha TaxID=3080828 RepID=A0ABZ0HM01_9HYPH|nr:AAA family ATPase [Methylocapsa sp. RX1]
MSEGLTADYVAPPLSPNDYGYVSISKTLPNVKPHQFIFDGQNHSAPAPTIVKGLVPTEGICFIAGQSGAGRTFIAIHLSVCAASGRSFFGRKIKERCGSVILAAEGEGGIQARIDAAKEALGIAGALPIAWRAVNDNLPEARRLRQVIEDLKDLSQKFRNQDGVRLGVIFVDAIGAAFGLEDENNAAQVNAAMRALRQIGNAVGAVIIPVHHYGKGKAAAAGMRGSSAFRGAADAILSVLVDRNEESGKSTNRSLALAKAREGEEGPISSFELRFVRLGFDEDGEPFGSCVIDPSDAPAAAKKDVGSELTRTATRALKALQEAIVERGKILPASDPILASVKTVTIDEWREYAFRRGITTSDQTRAKNIAFQRALKVLLDTGSIAKSEPYVWLI